MVEKCPFCYKNALTQNPQGIPVCNNHKNKKILDIECVCGEPLKIKKAKSKTYLNCINCGNISIEKIISLNPNIINGSDFKFNKLNVVMAK